MRTRVATLSAVSIMLFATTSMTQQRAPAPAGEPANTPASARAAEAEALIAKGVTLRQERKDAEALAYFRRAYEAHPTARARAQIGLGEQALGIWLEAETDLVAALADAEDPWVKRYREPLESALAIVRGRLGSLEIVVNVPDAEVMVDGAKLGSSSKAAAFRVVSGARTVVVQAPSHHPVSRSVVVPGGGVARETFDLVPADTVVAPPTDGSRSGARDGNDRPVTDSSAQRRLGWVLLGGSAVVLVSGGVAQVVRELQVVKYNDDATCPGLAVPASSQPPSCQSRISTAQTWQTVAIIGYAAGAALAATGAILLLTAPPSSKSGGLSARRPPSALCTAGPMSGGGATLWCEARF